MPHLKNIQLLNITAPKLYVIDWALDTYLSDAVDFLVDLCAVMVALLTTSGHRERHSRWMPSTDTCNLAQTFVCLTGQLLCVPTRCHA